MGDYFHPKSFLICFSALMLASIGVAGFLISHEGESHSAPTGKIMATVNLVPKAVEKEAEKAALPPVEASEPHTAEPHTAESHTTEIHTPENEAPTELAAEPEKEAVMDVEDSVAGLTESSSYGMLPVIGKDGMTAFSAYKAPFKLLGDTKGVISLVMVDYGLSDKASKAALERLPAPISFSISPYASNTQGKVTAARKNGQEVWMNIPIQGKDFAKNDNGPSSVLSGLKKDLNILRLNSSLGRATGYAGITFSVEPDFPDLSVELQAVIDAITSRGLGITQLDLADARIAAAAKQSKSEFVQSTVAFDSDAPKDVILKALESLESTAQNSGYVVTTFPPTQSAFDAISEWHATLPEKHIQLAPLTYAIHQKNLLK
jgi:hypothetical protein